MAFPNDFIDDMVAAVNASMPEITTILRTTESGAISWENAVRAALGSGNPLDPPFVLIYVGNYVDWEEYQPIEGGMKKAPVAFFYIERRSDVPGQEEAMELRLAAFSRALWASTYDSFCLPEKPSWDVSDTNAPNAVFLDQGNQPMYGGQLTGDFLVGEPGDFE